MSGGNFHGEPLALAADYAKTAVIELASISERRSARLVDGHLSGLPPFLTDAPGLRSGLMIAQYAAAALVNELQVLAHPASVDSIPTSANQEDHVSMGATSALHLARGGRSRADGACHRGALRGAGARLPRADATPAPAWRAPTDDCDRWCRTWSRTGHPRRTSPR